MSLDYGGAVPIFPLEFVKLAAEKTSRTPARGNQGEEKQEKREIKGTARSLGVTRGAGRRIMHLVST